MTPSLSRLNMCVRHALQPELHDAVVEIVLNQLDCVVGVVQRLVLVRVEAQDHQRVDWRLHVLVDIGGRVNQIESP